MLSMSSSFRIRGGSLCPSSLAPWRSIGMIRGALRILAVLKGGTDEEIRYLEALEQLGLDPDGSPKHNALDENGDAASWIPDKGDMVRPFP